MRTTINPACLRRTMLAPAGAVCGCCLEACAGEPVTEYSIPDGPAVWLHADTARCVRLAYEQWRHADERDADRLASEESPRACLAARGAGEERTDVGG